MKNKIKAIIFDMGGVLLQTLDESPRKQIAASIGISLEQLKFDVFQSDDAIKSEEGQFDKYELWKLILGKHGYTNLAKANEFDEKFWSGDDLNQELINIIKILKNNYMLGMISNAFKGARNWIELHYHFTKLFIFTVFSYEIGIRKPDPRIYHYACQELGVNPEEAVFVDDMKANVDGAKKAGLKGIEYRNVEQLKHELSLILGNWDVPDVIDNE